MGWRVSCRQLGRYHPECSILREIIFSSLERLRRCLRTRGSCAELSELPPTVTVPQTVDLITTWYPHSGEQRTQKLKSKLVRTLSLNVLPLKPGVGQYTAIHATPTARDFFRANFYSSGPFTRMFSKTSPDVSCVGCS